MLGLLDQFVKWWAHGEVDVKERDGGPGEKRVDIYVWAKKRLIFSRSIWLENLADQVFDIQDYGAKALDPDLPDWAVEEVYDALNQIARKHIAPIFSRAEPAAPACAGNCADCGCDDDN